ncbi:hypothetical protein [Embleya sp. NPDC020630]|uniref:hypothetical protein n=1 Tax=Embleya sp. NPDC020630 TaxID=3363979 RepID=UPI0037BBB76F
MAASEVTVAWITAGGTLTGAVAGAAAMRFGAMATVRAAVVHEVHQAETDLSTFLTPFLDLRRRVAPVAASMTVGPSWQRLAPMVPTTVPPWCLLADNAPSLLVMPGEVARCAAAVDDEVLAHQARSEPTLNAYGQAAVRELANALDRLIRAFPPAFKRHVRAGMGTIR